VDADVAARLIRESIVPCVSFLSLEVPDILEAQANARIRGVRGGGIYNLMHLTTAAKAGAHTLYTLDKGDFASIQRAGDPELRRP
jgi:predicted nucleic acid-binding protein